MPIFGDSIDRKALASMDSASNYPYQTTEQMAWGANLFVFIMGCGSVPDYKLAPCIEVPTNSEMFAHFIRLALDEITKPEDRGFCEGGLPLETGAVMRLSRWDALSGSNLFMNWYTISCIPTFGLLYWRR
jgi:hypothetical protein